MNEHSKLEEQSFLLPLFGVFLFSPALLSIFTDFPTLLGAPILHIYLFACWIILIAISFFLTHRLTSMTVASSEDNMDLDELAKIEKEIRK